MVIFMKGEVTNYTPTEKKQYVDWMIKNNKKAKECKNEFALRATVNTINKWKRIYHVGIKEENFKTKKAAFKHIEKEALERYSKARPKIDKWFEKAYKQMDSLVLGGVTAKDETISLKNFFELIKKYGGEEDILKLKELEDKLNEIVKDRERADKKVRIDTERFGIEKDKINNNDEKPGTSITEVKKKYGL